MRTLEIFVEVARLRGFSAAGHELGMTQSAVSQRIGQLEKKLGVQLIDRSVRPLELTPAGQEYLKGCREVLERLEEIERKVSKLRPRMDGALSVAAIYSAGIDLLSHIRDAFCETHPGVEVDVEYLHPDQVHESVRGDRCDLGIVSYPDRYRDVGVIPLRDERMAVVCAPTHPLADRRRVQASQLGEWPMAMFDPTLPVGRSIRRYLKENGVTPEVSAEFDNIDTIKSAVAVTDQIAILPRRTVQREVASQSLAACELQPELVRPLGIIHHRGGRGRRPLTPVAQAFVDFLLKHAGPNADLAEEKDAPRRPLAGAKS
ncbi:MAG: LysR family transcriptional regulator [Planctomycetes bacterium]|nr:LysR family transcriptional regulator [Planctomycetota bacterium]